MDDNVIKLTAAWAAGRPTPRGENTNDRLDRLAKTDERMADLVADLDRAVECLHGLNACLDAENARAQAIRVEPRSCCRNRERGLGEDGGRSDRGHRQTEIALTWVTLT